jgi:hypothetical protein
MKLHKFYPGAAALIFVFVSSCTQTKIVVTPVPATETPSPKLGATQTASPVETGLASPMTVSPGQTDPFSLDTPYFDRQFNLVNTCDESSCLFSDNVNHPAYPIGYAIVMGHYLKVERTRDGETETCDGLVFDNAPAELLSEYENYFKNDHAVYSKTTDGKSVINIQLWNEDEATKQIIFSSSSEKPITLRILNEPPLYYGTVACFSPVSILDATKILTASDVSHVYTITEADNGKVFTYVVTSRFSLVLDDAKYPSSKTICATDTILGAIAGTGSYEIFKTGTCQLQNGNFQVTIIGLPDLWGSP